MSVTVHKTLVGYLIRSTGTVDTVDIILSQDTAEFLISTLKDMMRPDYPIGGAPVPIKKLKSK